MYMIPQKLPFAYVKEALPSLKCRSLRTVTFSLDDKPIDLEVCGLKFIHEGDVNQVEYIHDSIQLEDPVVLLGAMLLQKDLPWTEPVGPEHFKFWTNMGAKGLTPTAVFVTAQEYNLIVLPGCEFRFFLALNNIQFEDVRPPIAPKMVFRSK